MAEHEKLEVYHCAKAVAVKAEAYARRIPLVRSDLRDQLRRASASVPLNIAEGASEYSPAEKSKFYRIARRSAAEAMAIIDLAEAIAPDRSSEEIKAELSRICAMLTGLVTR